MPVQIICDRCGNTMFLSDDFTGRHVRCKDCDELIPVPTTSASSSGAFDLAPNEPWMGDDLQPAATSSPAGRPGEADMKTCPYCAEQIRAAAVRCRFCGSDLQEFPFTGRSATPVADSLGRSVRDKNDSSNAIALFVTGLLGCFSPICAIFGTVFLMNRSYDFPNKTLAIIGTVLHWMWTALLAIIICGGGLGRRL